MNTAIIQSCDVYFYELALSLGIDNIHEFLTQFGFGKKTLDGSKPMSIWSVKKPVYCRLKNGKEIPETNPGILEKL